MVQLHRAADGVQIRKRIDQIPISGVLARQAPFRDHRRREALQEIYAVKVSLEHVLIAADHPAPKDAGLDLFRHNRHAQADQPAIGMAPHANAVRVDERIVRHGGEGIERIDDVGLREMRAGRLALRAAMPAHVWLEGDKTAAGEPVLRSDIIAGGDVGVGRNVAMQEEDGGVAAFFHRRIGDSEQTIDPETIGLVGGDIALVVRAGVKRLLDNQITGRVFARAQRLNGERVAGDGLRSRQDRRHSLRWRNRNRPIDGHLRRGINARLRQRCPIVHRHARCKPNRSDQEQGNP